MNIAFLFQLSSCLLMTGVIWIVQLVHYPAFRFISQDQFFAFNRFHQFSISFVVMPAMIVEVLTCFFLVPIVKANYLFTGLTCLLVLIWVSTFFLSVPLHDKLVSHGYDISVINKLVLTNWPRTIFWTLRSVGLLYILSTSAKSLILP